MLCLPSFSFCSIILFLVSTNTAASGNSRFPVALPLYTPVDNIAINCGVKGKSTANDGREWIGDIGSKFTPIIHPQNTKSIATKSIFPRTTVDNCATNNPVPYMTARISPSQFSYTIQVSPGQKFIRLHFHPASYPGFKRSKAFFTVKAGRYTLLSNFSPALTADALGLTCLDIEFCVNVEDETRALTITFSPSELPSTTGGGAYAFINGIQIVSMPTGLYYTTPRHDNDPERRDSNSGVYVVGQRYKIYIDNNTALETVYRLNIGGGGLILPVEDSGMFRCWFDDSVYLLDQLGDLTSTTTTNNIAIEYLNIPTCSAPPKLYQTAWSVNIPKNQNQMFSFTWKLPVDLGFRYLVRLHFCELEYHHHHHMKKTHHREFSIFINNQIVEAAYVDLIGGNGMAMYRDYMVTMEGERLEGKRDIFIALHHHFNGGFRIEQSDGLILKGLEMFKLSNPDNNLATGVNPDPLQVVVHAPSTNTNTPKIQKFVLFPFGGVNTIATIVVILITLLNVVVYQLRIWVENYGKRSISKEEGSCRRFSIVEIRLATNNFDDALVIGRGGFGSVYKGLIDDGAITVAIKRLNLTSNQGAHEFWTEVEMLSKLRQSHLVALIGYCNDFQEMILVYEYMSHGTLADHLYKGNGISGLAWEQRLNICIGAASGLDYLHRCTQPRIIHRDVKTTNILLDDKWVAKISDFGLSKIDTTSQSHTHVSTDVKGTFGYLDPEYFLTHRLTWKTDVYAFGVVLLEVLCGRPAVDTTLEEEEQHSLVTWAKSCIKEGTFDQIIDASIREQISPRCLKVLVELASKCLHSHPNVRPTMFDVVQSLKFALVSQDQSTNDSSVEIEEDEEKEFIDTDWEETEDISKEPIIGQGNIAFQSKEKTKLTFSKIFQYFGFKARSVDMPRGKTSDEAFKPKYRYAKLKPLIVMGDELGVQLPLPQIEAAENNFHSRIVYKGQLEDGKRVFVKHVLKSLLLGCEFWGEIERLSKLRHPHLVPLIGYFPCKSGVLLVSDLMANGSLHDHLYGGEGYSPLSWNQRLRICIDAARGLHYLHSGKYTIIHARLKTTKILLDEGWNGRISDFGLPDWGSSDNIFNHRTSSIRPIGGDIYRTSVYAAPEHIHGILTNKSNVYSFGVVLLEVLSAREEALYLPFAGLNSQNLLHWVRKSIDPYLIEKIALECLREFVGIVESCLQSNWHERPSMGDVVERLEHALQLQEMADSTEYAECKAW